MAYDGAAWDETNPTNNTLASELDDIAQDIKKGVSGRMAREHLWPSAQSATNEAGLHRYVTLAQQTSTPALVVGTNTQAGALFVSSGSSNALMFVNSNSNLATVVYGGGRSALPPGSILSYGGAAAPVGFYLCNGTAVSRTTDAALFAAISTSYGTGDGSTTFNVPDLRGRTLVCQSAAGIFATVGASTGEVEHTLTIAEMPAHVHYTEAGQLGGGSTDGSQRWSGGTAASGLSSGSTGGDGAHNNVQPSLVAQAIIAR